jgi:NAD(P)-dependent dehydrogenase (short-subunit alcohol dehydrogenase family)
LPNVRPEAKRDGQEGLVVSYVARPQDGVAWVSSASTGLGRAVALALADQGWTVAATGRNPVDLETLVAACADCSGKIVAYPGDLTRGGVVAQIVKRIESKQGPIVLAILPPSEDEGAAAGALTRETLEHALTTSFVSVTNALLPVMMAMRERKQGQIAILSSFTGYRGLRHWRGTGPAKAALKNLAEGLHSELVADGVRLQIVTAGMVGPPAPGARPLARLMHVSVDAAAARVVSGLKRSSGFEIAFPRRLLWPLRLVGALPDPVYFAITRRTRSKESRAEAVRSTRRATRTPVA